MPYAAEWRRYRRTRAIQIVCAIASVGFIVYARTAVPQDWNLRWNSLVSMLLAPTLVGLWFSSLDLINWKCPRCGSFFSYPAPDARQCQHCGLKKFEESE